MPSILQSDQLLVNIDKHKQTSQSVNVTDESAGPLTMELESQQHNIQVQPWSVNSSQRHSGASG